MAEEVAAIAALRGERQRRLAELDGRRAARAEAMRALAERIQDRESRVARLRTDERRLVELVDALRASLYRRRAENPRQPDLRAVARPAPVAGER